MFAANVCRLCADATAEEKYLRGRGTQIVSVCHIDPADGV